MNDSFRALAYTVSFDCVQCITSYVVNHRDSYIIKLIFFYFSALWRRIAPVRMMYCPRSTNWFPTVMYVVFSLMFSRPLLNYSPIPWGDDVQSIRPYATTLDHCWRSVLSATAKCYCSKPYITKVIIGVVRNRRFSRSHTGMGWQQRLDNEQVERLGPSFDPKLRRYGKSYHKLKLP